MHPPELLPPPLPEVEIAKPYPGFWQAVGLFLFYTAGMVIVIVPFAISDSIAKTTFVKNPFVLGLATLAAATVAMYWARKKTGLSAREIAGPLAIPGPVLGPMASMIVGQLFVTLIVLLWLLRFFPKLMPTETYGLDKTLLGAAFALVIAAPLSEEFLFRGVFVRGFAARYGETNAILWTAAMFACAHMSLGKLFGTFLLGLIFGWWRLRMGNIWPGVLGHALNNAAPVLIAVAARQGSGAAGAKKTLPAFTAAEPVIAIVGAVLLVNGYFAMKRYFDSHRIAP